MQFLESIKILDGKIYLADLHLQRVNKTLQAHFINNIPSFDVTSWLLY